MTILADCRRERRLNPLSALISVIAYYLVIMLCQSVFKTLTGRTTYLTRKVYPQCLWITLCISKTFRPKLPLLLLFSTDWSIIDQLLYSYIYHDITTTLE